MKPQLCLGKATTTSWDGNDNYFFILILKKRRKILKAVKRDWREQVHGFGTQSCLRQHCATAVLLCPSPPPQPLHTVSPTAVNESQYRRAAFPGQSLPPQAPDLCSWLPEQMSKLGLQDVMATNVAFPKAKDFPVWVAEVRTGWLVSPTAEHGQRIPSSAREFSTKLANTIAAPG